MAEYVRVPESDWQGICDAVRGKTGETAQMVSGEVAEKIENIESGGGGGGSGVRIVQFTVTLDADSLYLPMDALTEIPEFLSVDCYDAEMVNATTGAGSNVTPTTDKITYAIATILPLKLNGCDSGTNARLHMLATMEYQLSSRIRGTLFWTKGTDRHGGEKIGWTQPAYITSEEWQSVFAFEVQGAGYALDGAGTLCLLNINNNAKKFAGGIPYTVTALYDIIPPTVGGYVEVDRTVNATNVTNTVPEETAE